MNIQSLQYFIVAAECQNFTKAAEKCYITQTAMSMQISKMEKSLGFDLFIRERQRVRLTPAGQDFYRSAVQIVGEYDRAVAHSRNVASGDTGKVYIGMSSCIEMLAMMPALHSFKRKNPNVELVLEQIRPRELDALLSDRHLDMAFCWEKEMKPISDTENIQINTSPAVVAMNGEHPLSGYTEISPELLKMQTAIMIEWRDASDPYYRMNASWRALGIDPQRIIMVSNLEEQLAMLQLEEAVAIIPGYVRHIALGGALTYRPLAVEKDAAPISQGIEGVVQISRGSAADLLVDFLTAEHQKFSL